MSAADNIKCDICGNHHHPMTECRDALRSLASAAGSQIAVADLRDWISQLREKFGLPAKVKGRDKWWDGYEGAIQDLESFVSRQSENVEPTDTPRSRIIMPLTEREMRLAQEALAKRPITPAEPVPASMLKAPGRKKSTGVRDALHSKMKAANEAYQNKGRSLRTRDVELEFGLKPGSLKHWRSIRLRNGKDGVIGAYLPRKKNEKSA